MPCVGNETLQHHFYESFLFGTGFPAAVPKLQNAGDTGNKFKICGSASAPVVSGGKQQFPLPAGSPVPGGVDCGPDGLFYLFGSDCLRMIVHNSIV